MKNSTTKEILYKIDLLEPFEAVSESMGFKISVKSYVPYICTSIHSGKNLYKNLEGKINLFSFQRWQEEDPCTDEFISDLPITISALDSRYEYDLNRGRDECIYKEAWGKRVWKKELFIFETKRSLRKYDEFYQIIHALVEKLEFLFKRVFIFDIHSYNYMRTIRDEEYPLFNIGTHFLHKKFRDETNCLLESLQKQEIEGLSNITRENDVFHGKGYFAEYISQKFENTALFPIEVKKVYCNEKNGVVYKDIVLQLKMIFNEVITKFVDTYTDNISYHILDNFQKDTSDKNHLIISNKIALLMRTNYVGSNDKKEYSDQEISHLISNKTVEVVSERLKEAYTVYVCHLNKIIACGSLVRKDDHIEAKMLNVGSCFKGMGLARKICDIRENYARSAGYKNVYIESLKFENTIKFHESRGFYKTKSIRNLKYSIYMCKDL